MSIDASDLTVTSAEITSPNTRSAPSRFVFGDYRRVDGMLLPWAVTEEVGDQTTWRIEFNNVTVSTSGPTK